MFIAVDFDGTIADHEFPDIGKPVPGAFEWLKRFQEAGADLILWTMRSDGQDVGDVLTDAVDFCRDNGIEFAFVNENPQSWTTSQKAYAHAYIDDAAVGCPLHENPRMGGKPFVDWDVVGPCVMAMIEGDTQQQEVMSEHDPGPWIYRTTEGSDHKYCTVYVKYGKAIARHVLPADARLIVLAHEMLVACEAMIHAAKLNDPAAGAVAATLAANAIDKLNQGT